LNIQEIDLSCLSEWKVLLAIELYDHNACNVELYSMEILT